jgi:hypothetical protein
MLSRIIVVFGGFLLLTGGILSFYSFDLAMSPGKCAAPVSDPRTAMELWTSIRGGEALKGEGTPDPIDLAIREITAMQDARSIGAKTEISRFFQAAYLMEGYVDQSGHSDLPDTADYGTSAETILRRLKKDFPENGIYPYYLAGILKETGAGREAVLQEFLAAFSAPKMDSHVETVTRRIASLSLRDSSSFEAGRALVGQLRLPNPLKSFFALRSLLEERPSVEGLAERVAERNQALLDKATERSMERKGLVAFGMDRVLGDSGDLRMSQALLASALSALGKTPPGELTREESELKPRFSWGARIAALKGCDSLRKWEYGRAKEVLTSIVGAASDGHSSAHASESQE